MGDIDSQAPFIGLTGSTSRHCYILKCANGDYRLQKWRQTPCSVHHIRHSLCNCPPPFRLFTFPTKKQPEARQRWINILARAASVNSHQYLEPKKSHRVCSLHFIDGKPTKEHPDPGINLGHKRKNVDTSQTERGERYKRRAANMELPGSPKDEKTGLDATMKPLIPRKSTRHSAKTAAYLEMLEQLHRHPNRKKTPQSACLSVDVVMEETPEPTKESDATTPHPKDELSIFGYTVTKLNPLVTARLQNLLPQLNELCSSVNVKVVRDPEKVSLEGDWERLCEARLRVTEMLQSPPVVQPDTVKSAEALSEETREVHVSVELREGHLQEDQPPVEVGVHKEAEPATDVIILENTNNSDVVTLTIPRITEGNSEVDKDTGPPSDIPVAQECTNSAREMDSVFCIHCKAKFVDKDEMRKHMQEDHGSILNVSNMRSAEPEGELTELLERSTKEFRVMIDARQVEWYQCTACPMIGSRRFRMTEHYRISHLENCDIPFKIIEKPAMVGVVDVNQANLGENNPDWSTARTAVNAQTSKVSQIQLLHPEKTSVICKRCGYQTTASGIHNHMKLKHAKHLYCCLVCNRSFASLFLLRKHFRLHVADAKSEHTNKQNFECEKCGKTFTRKVDMVHHKKLGRSCCDGGPADPTQYNPPYADGMYSCGECKYVAKQRVHVIQHHARRHAPKEFPCSQCTQTFAYARDLENHAAVTHATEKVHKCEECGKCFASVKYLTMHKQRHGKVKKHFCSICNKGFLEKYRLTKHSETHKAREERRDLHYCSVCSKGFSSDAYRKDHENIHTGLEPYSCKICGKTLKAAGHMWKHMQYYHAKNMHACPYQTCKKSFRFKSGLKAHLVTHTRDGEHRCVRCGKVYTQRQTLLKHVCKKPTSTTTVNVLEETTVVKPCNAQPTIDVNLGTADAHQNIYMCSECNKIFYEWDEVNEHMQVHVPAGLDMTKDVSLNTEDTTIQLPVQFVTGENSEVRTAALNLVDTNDTVNLVSDVNDSSFTTIGQGQEELSSSQVWCLLLNPIDKGFPVDAGNDADSSVAFVETPSAVQVEPAADEPQTDILQQALVEQLT